MERLNQSGLKHRLNSGRETVDGGEQPLHALNGQKLDQATLLVLLGRKNRFGARYFQVFLSGGRGQVSEQPVVTGLFNSGPYPSYNWVEVISLAQHVTFAPSMGDKGRILNLSQSGLDQELLRRIADLIPPGGHMMIEYDSPGQWETARSLRLGIPPAATPLGSLLHAIGCGAGFRDWHFAEGGSEGPRKLQGYKPLNEEHARQKAGELARELSEFLDRPIDPRHADVEEPARQRAVEILSKMEIYHSDIE